MASEKKQDQTTEPVGPEAPAVSGAAEKAEELDQRMTELERLHAERVVELEARVKELEGQLEATKAKPKSKSEEIPVILENDVVTVRCGKGKRFAYSQKKSADGLIGWRSGDLEVELRAMSSDAVREMGEECAHLPNWGKGSSIELVVVISGGE